MPLLSPLRSRSFGRPTVPGPSFAGQRVLVVGPAAESAALRALLRGRGARVIASSDIEMALTLVERFPIDVLVVDPELATAEGEPFVAAVRRRGGPSAHAIAIAPRVC
jgi:DNA-binding response OmpR family regulator